MKLIHALPIALAASLLPTAGAQIYPANNGANDIDDMGAPFAISARAGGELMLRMDMKYPPRAASLGRDGSCQVAVDVDANGRAAGTEIQACTSPLFEREAARIARSLRLTETSGRTVLLDIRWTIDAPEMGRPPASSTASVK